MDTFTKCLLNERVNLRAHDLNVNIQEHLQKVLAQRLEGKCTQHGYVRPGSVSVQRYSAGTVLMSTLNGDISFRVWLNAEVCLPPVGSVLQARVRNMNRFGVLCEVVDGDKVIVESIIAKSANVCASEMDLEQLKQGDAVLVEVLARKFELGDRRISVVGRIVKSLIPSPPETGTIANGDTVVKSDDESDELEGSEVLEESDEEVEEEDSDRDDVDDDDGDDDDDDDDEAPNRKQPVIKVVDEDDEFDASDAGSVGSGASEYSDVEY